MVGLRGEPRMKPQRTFMSVGGEPATENWECLVLWKLKGRCLKSK